MTRIGKGTTFEVRYSWIVEITGTWMYKTGLADQFLSTASEVVRLWSLGLADEAGAEVICNLVHVS
jgi:hypothetical protein